MNNELEIYCTAHSNDELPLLQDLTRQTFLNVLNPRMLSGHMQGLFLQMLVSMIHPKRVLEIGTFTGYSALCIAQNLDSDALLHTIEINDEVAHFAKDFFAKSDFASKIVSHVGDAADIIDRLDEMFQLVFIDANKRDYINYYNKVFDKVESGGFILADNVLWDGHVLDVDKCKNDAQTKGISEFNKMIKNDSRVEKLMLPLRDGLFIIRKK
jgi:predicted O-methyltransferase YrrM